MSAIEQKTINGVAIRCAVFDPAGDDIYAVYKPGGTIKGIGDAAGADVAINFNYADTDNGVPIGRVIADGKVVVQDIPKTVPRDELYMLPDRTLHIGKAPANALWAIQGSPPLLRGGKIVVNEGIARDQLGQDVWSRPAFRTAAGITSAGQLIMLRTMNEITLITLASIMLQLGCVDALNGDGGGSSYMWPEDNGWGRKLGSALVAKRKKADMPKTFKIAVDAGHGPETPGKRTPDGSMREYQFNSAVARCVGGLLAQYQGAETRYTFADDHDVPLKERTDAANTWGADVFVSIHANASGDVWDDSTNGIETYVYSSKPAAAVKLAQNVQAALVAETGRPNRGVKSDDFHVLRETQMTAILAECGFMTSHAEADLLKSDAYRQSCARAIVKGLAETYGLKTKPTEKYADIVGHWAEAEIRKVIADGIMEGYDDGTFRPDQPLTRAEFAYLKAHGKI